MDEKLLLKLRKNTINFLQSTGIFLLEFVKIAVLAGVTIVLVRHFLFKPFYVKGASMEPTFYEHEYLLIDELSYRFRVPERGEVIVFKYPDHPTECFIKRIIALPSERIKISEGKIIIYNDEYPEGMGINEEYLPGDILTIGEKITTLGDNEYFVMGDNRPNSYDSRRFGSIHYSDIIGRTWFRGWPFSRVEIFHRPDFNF